MKHLTRYFLSLLAVLCLFAAGLTTPAEASDYADVPVENSGSIGTNLNWTLYVDGTLVISGTGSMRNYTSSTNCWPAYKTYITEVIIEDGVTTIGDYAFYYFSNLASVTIPDSVTSIGEHAFQGCSLTDITLEDGLITIGSGAFYCCSGLTEVTIPNSVTSIGGSAFDSCTGLTSVTLGTGVATIGNYAFSSCPALTEIRVAEGNQNYSAANGVIYNKNKDTLVMASAAIGSSFTVPASVTTIGAYAFYGCKNLTEVTLPDSVTTIGEYGFWSCSNLAEVTIPDSVTSIGNYAFYSCNGLTEVTFEGNAPAIEAKAFNGVTATCYYPADDASWTEDVKQNYGGTLTWVALTNTVAEGTCGDVTWRVEDETLILTPTDGIEGEMKAYSAGKYPWNDYLEEITSIEVQEGVLNITSNAFTGAENLEEVFLSETVEEIEPEAFADSGRKIEITICNPDCEIFDEETTLGDVRWIFGYTDSTAEEYADEYGCDFCGESNTNRTPGHDTVQILVEANCVEGEHTRTYCTNGCGYAYNSKYRSDPSDTHSYNEQDVCTVCGRHKSDSDDVTTLSGQCGDALSWTYDKANAKLMITGTGDMWIYEAATYLFLNEDEEAEERDGTTAPWNYYAEQIETLVLPEGMTTVGSFAFTGCSSLETLTLPGTLTSIGISAFQNCRGLTGTLVIPDSVVRIGQSAFQNCRSFTGLDLGEGLVTIFDSAFANFGTPKSPITDLTIPASVRHINSSAFYEAGFSGTLTILGPVEELAEEAFRGCQFSRVTLSEGLKILAERSLAFYDAEGEDLPSITIDLPLSLECIAEHAIDGYPSGSVLTLNYAGCESLWIALVDSGTIDERMTDRDVNLVTQAHSFTTYTPDAGGTTETASCDFGCGKTDTREIPVEPDPTEQIVLAYDEDSAVVMLINVPKELTVLLAGYQDDQLVYLAAYSGGPAIASPLPADLTADTVRVFFLTEDYLPAGDARSITL